MINKPFWCLNQSFQSKGFWKLAVNSRLPKVIKVWSKMVKFGAWGNIRRNVNIPIFVIWNICVEKFIGSIS